MADAQLMRCDGCGATNRVPRDKLARGLQPLCGRCKGRLGGDATPLTASDANFAELVERAPLPVLVDAWAPWCGPCRSIAPLIDELAAELEGRLRIVKLNVDENPVLASRFNLRSIPTLLVMRGGREVDRLVGAHPKAEILRRLGPLLA
ncbi:MAG: thioredoxin TrxC [bacterium]